MTLDVEPAHQSQPHKSTQSPKRIVDYSDPDCTAVAAPAPLPARHPLSDPTPSTSASINYPLSPSSIRQSGTQAHVLRDADNSTAPTTDCQRLQTPASSLNGTLPQTLHPASQPGNAPRIPTSPSNLSRPPKRVLEDVDIDFTSLRKRHRLQSPNPLPTSSPVSDWLSTLPQVRNPSSKRSTSAPATFSGRSSLTIIDEPSNKHTTLAAIQRMSQSQGPNLKRGSNASSQNLRPSTSHPIYRSLLFNNGIRMDHTGRRIPRRVREVVDKEILRQRSSPPLSEERVLRVIDKAEALADSAEGKVSSLMGTDLLPVNRPDIEEGGNTLWSTDALPCSLEYGQPLAAPKPDFHYGYPPGQRSQWTARENAVADHPVARPYTQPARGNRFPFFALEVKSEARGGTIWHAENQAAGSGSYCVKALLWFLELIFSKDVIAVSDCIAFTAAVTHREVIFHVHYFSPKDDCFFMSYLRRFSTVDVVDIQTCHDTVKNILDYGLTIRQSMIKSVLAQLYPFPDQWKEAQPPSTAMMSTSPSNSESRSNKNARYNVKQD
ncbi:MAG: hypothetical protein Q9216_005442 [Gyalolechia sp. 2 TL-2023]